MEQAKLLSMTVILAVLVWAAADSLVNETTTMGITLEVVPAAPGSTMLVEITDPPGGTFVLEISGPRRAIEAVKTQAPLRGRIRIPDQPTGLVTLTLDRDSLKRDISEQVAELRSLTLVSVQPASVELRADRMTERDLALVLGRLALGYDVEPQLERATSRIRLRESRLRELAPHGNLPPMDISADVDRLFREQPPGESKTISVALSAQDYGPGAELNPRVVDVTATVRSQRVEAEIPAVPVLLAVSFPNLERSYRPVARDGTALDIVAPTVRVRGPGRGHQQANSR